MSTGDIAALDEDGFLQITDRLSRFSKIGGEMVPHVKVEEKLHEALGTTEIVFAVCGVPDPKKGERLVVLHTLPEDRLAGAPEETPATGAAQPLDSTPQPVFPCRNPPAPGYRQAGLENRPGIGDPAYELKNPNPRN